jgi:two-component system chemotaxis response regulator CheB
MTEAPVSLASTSGRLIAIGASTGGTEATPRLLARLSPAAPPVLIVQHMPAGFSARYAARLNGLGPLAVSEARDGEPLQSGHAYVAPGGQHLAVDRAAGGGFIARVTDGELVQRHRPSVDVLFRSVAKVAGERAIGVMLTGMGGDGALAMRLLREAGAYNLAQDEATSAIFGMPREAIRAGACQEVLPLDAIGPRVMALLGLRSETSPADR